MKVVRNFLLGCVLVALAGCPASRNKELIIGKWKGTRKEGGDFTVMYEFSQDGAMKIESGFINLSGAYKFIDANTIETDLEGKKGKAKIVSLTKEKLVLTREGKKIAFTRSN